MEDIISKRNDMLCEQYQKGVNINILSHIFGMSVESIITVLDRMGLYNDSSKFELAGRIGVIAELSPADTYSLVCANRGALQKILKIISY